MTGAQTFKAAVPALIEAAAGGDASTLLARVRQALIGLKHYELPVGAKLVPDPLFPSTWWVVAIAGELKSPNMFMSDWRIRKQLRASWGRKLKDAVCRLEGVASFTGLEALGRAPKCTDRMTIQVVRLVPSLRNFLRDDDNTTFCAKQLGDAMVDVGLIKDDRREWFTAAPLLQDVSPITVPGVDKKRRPIDVGVPVVLFILRPAGVAGLLPGVSDHADRRIHATPPRESAPDDRRAEEGRALPRVRGRTRTRAVDV